MIAAMTNGNRSPFRSVEQLAAGCREREFAELCAREPHVTYVIEPLGDWDYELNLEIPTIESYRAILQRMTREFSDIIQEYDGLMVDRIEKYVCP